MGDKRSAGCKRCRTLLLERRDVVARRWQRGRLGRGILTFRDFFGSGGRMPMRTGRLWFVALGAALLLSVRSSAVEKGDSSEALPPGAQARLGSPSLSIPNGLVYADLSPD